MIRGDITIKRVCFAVQRVFLYRKDFLRRFLLYSSTHLFGHTYNAFVFVFFFRGMILILLFHSRVTDEACFVTAGATSIQRIYCVIRQTQLFLQTTNSFFTQQHIRFIIPCDVFLFSRNAFVFSYSYSAFVLSFSFRLTWYSGALPLQS